MQIDSNNVGVVVATAELQGLSQERPTYSSSTLRIKVGNNNSATKWEAGRTRSHVVKPARGSEKYSRNQL